MTNLLETAAHDSMEVAQLNDTGKNDIILYSDITSHAIQIELI